MKHGPVLVAAFVLIASWCSFAQTNLVQNGGFERGKEGQVEEWRLEGGQGKLMQDAQEKSEGSASLNIVQTGAESVAAIQSPIPCATNAIYRFDCMIKSNCQTLVTVQVFAHEKDETPLCFTVASGTFPQWTSHFKVLRTPATAHHVKVSLATKSQGEAWFDSVSLIKVGEPPSLHVPRAETPPKIDGGLDEPAWKNAAVSKLLFLAGGKGAAPKQPTEVMLTYDDSYLYIAFRCHEPNPTGMKRTAKSRGANVWDDDCVEVFLDIECTKCAYLNFAVNSLGTTAQTRRLQTKRWFTQWFDSGAPDEGITKWDAYWRAKAVVLQGEWMVEISLAFTDLGRTPTFGEIWNANFCRRRQVEVEEKSSWSYLDTDRLDSPEEFGQIIFAGGQAKPPTLLQPRPRRSHQVTLIPRPQEFKVTGSAFEFTPEVAIYVPHDKPAALTAAQFFRDDVNTRGGYELQFVATPKTMSNLIILDHEPLSDVTKKFLPAVTATRKGKTTSLTLPEQAEGYLLDVRTGVALLVGRDERGLWNGVQTLRQLVRFEDDGVRITGVRVLDWPALGVRACHFSEVRRDDVAAYRRLVDLITLLKFNTIFIEVDDNLRYERHPDIAHEHALSKSQLSELVAYARERQFEVIPQVQTFGHFNYVLSKEAYKALAENPTPHPKWGRYTYCPSNPQTYKLVFDLFDEVIEVFKPKYFHIGHDEITFGDIAKCERCKTKMPKDLLAEDVKKLYDYLASKGIKLLIWCDQFEANRNGGPPTNTAEALPLLPKDIIICDWHYEPDAEFPSLKFFKEKGFSVLACGWYKPRNIFNLARAAEIENALGYCATTWCPTARIPELPEMMTMLIVTAENAWSPGNPSLEQMPSPPTDVFRRLYHFGAKEEVAKEFFTVDIRAQANAEFRDTAHKTGWLGLGPDYDMSLMPGGVQWLVSAAGGHEVPFDIISPGRSGKYSCIILANQHSPKNGPPERSWQISISEKARSLFFLHTTSQPPLRELSPEERYNKKVGWYEITYQDGSKAQVELVYGKNITDWNTRLGTSDADVVWRGRTRAGALIQICAYEWKNPKPELTIKALEFVSTRTEVSPVLIAITGMR